MDGMGKGRCRFGCQVPVNIEVQVTLDGAGMDGVQEAIEQGVRQYLKDLAMSDRWSGITGSPT